MHKLDPEDQKFWVTDSRRPPCKTCGRRHPDNEEWETFHRRLGEVIALVRSGKYQIDALEIAEAILEGDHWWRVTDAEWAADRIEQMIASESTEL